MKKKRLLLALPHQHVKKNLILRLAFMMISIFWVSGVVFAGSTGMGQQKKVSGTVTDDQGAVAGASVIIEGTTIGVITDNNGKFSLEYSKADAVLVISFVGYKTERIPIDGKTELNIQLVSQISELNDVVVIGYGTVKKRDLTGSVSSIKSTEIMKTASNNALQAMQGKIAGVDLTKNSGAAGSGVTVNLRGNRSISATNEPMFIVDGIEYGSVLDLNASDIESIDVLKDASSTAIYGSRGANGVIIITTKGGLLNGINARKSKVSINSYMSFNSPTNYPEKMNANQEYLMIAERMRYAAEKATSSWGSTKLSDYSPESVLSNVVSSPYDKSVYQIWKEGGIHPLDLVLHNSITKNTEIALSGSDDKTSFDLSIGYMDENGILKNDYLKRYNGKVNLNHKITNNLIAGLNLQYTMRDGNRRDDGQYYNAMEMYSISQIYAADSTLLDRPSELGRSYTNPLINELPGYYVNNIRSNRLFSNLFLDWEIVKGLHLKSVLGIDNNTRRQGSYEDYMTKNLFQASLGSKFSVENSMNYSYTLQNTLNYSLTKGKNDIQLLAGQSAEQNVFESHSAYGNAGLDHFLKSSFYDLTNIPSDKRMLDNRYVKSNMLSYFGRINYKLMNRYLLTGTIRGDGSSVLSEGNKWAYFPSLASAWVISEEPFLRDIEAINNLKLRASWGKAGNAAISPYKTLTVLGMDKVPYTFGNSVILGQVPANLGNVNLTWETTETYDGGLDFSILKERISGTIDGYYSKTFDLLLPRGLPATSVFPQVLENVGNTENIGLEAALNFRVIAKKDFSWNSDITFSTNKDKILSLATGQIKDVSIPNAALIVGQPVRAFYNYEPNGTWSIADAAEAAKYGKIPGDVKFVDVNHDYKIDDADKRLYNKSPQFIAGWNNTISYKGLSLSALAYARVGQWISYQVNTWYLPTEPGGGPVLDYWTPEHQNAKFPRPGISSQVDLPPLAFEKASFVKIKEVILGYSLPKKVISNVGISNLRLYGSLQNYFTFSNLKNYDPERGGSASDPLLKQLVFGINLEF